MSVNVYFFLDLELVLIDCGMNIDVILVFFEGEFQKYGLVFGDFVYVYIIYVYIDYMGMVG